MSWHFLPELAADFSPQFSLDGVSSVPLRRTDIAAVCFCKDKKTVCYPCFLYGTTFKTSKENRGVAKFRLSLRDSPASRSHQPENGSGKRTSGICGRIPSESYARWEPNGRCWKTSQGWLLQDISEPSFQTWLRRGSMRNGMCFPQLMMERRIFGKGSGLWPTPNVPNGGRKPKKGMSRTGMTPDGKKRQVGLENAIEMWATPQKSDADKNTPKTRYKNGGLHLIGQILWRTPCSRDSHPSVGQARQDASSKNGNLPGSRLLSGKENALLALALNPDWVEALMGWPIGWTDLKPLETDKFQAWRSGLGWS